jgi:hypothetical protein
MVFELPATVISSLPEQTVTYLADITSDGTSNGMIMTIVRVVLAMIAVILAGGFGINIAKISLAEAKGGGGAQGPGGGASGGKTKSMMDETKNFALAEGLIISVWAIIELVNNVFSGVLSGG